MARRVKYWLFVPILQAAAILLLLYLAMGDATPQVYDVTSTIPIDVGASAQSDNPNAHRDGIATQPKKTLDKQAVEMKDEVLPDLAVSSTILASRTFEIDDISDALFAKLREYDNLSENEKRKLEAALAEQMMNNEKGRELLKALDELEAWGFGGKLRTSGGLEVEETDNPHEP